ncbi:MAG TPA: lipoate--protein ligase family protein [bacterium]|nr:lipoate--protein ligase family protein [bacterium]
MMDAFRYLETSEHSAAFNMGLDEAILESVATGVEPPTLRLYAWKPYAVSIGYFQGIEDEVDLGRCATLGIDVVRRLTGGGAVFHAQELTYSLVAPDSHPLVAGTILDSYRSICSGVINGLEVMGIHAEFVPLNDVCANGRKLSGNAQTRKRGCVLQHGTIILGLDVDTMFTILKVPNEKLKGKLMQDVRSRVSSVSDMLGRSVGYMEAVLAFERGFSEALGGLGSRSDPSQTEMSRAMELATERFASASWTYKR